MEANNLDMLLQGINTGLLKYIHTLNLDNEEQKIANETFMKAIVHNRKQNSEYLRIWSNIIMRKAFINNYNRIVMKDPANGSGGNILMIYTDADLDQEIIFNKIVGNIEGLNIRLREPFKMFVEGYKYTEIADAMKIKIETVKKRIFIARAQLMLQNI